MSRRRPRRVILDIDEMLSEDCTPDQETICVECTECGKAFRVRVSGDSLRVCVARMLGCSTNVCPDCSSELYGDEPLPSLLEEDALGSEMSDQV